VGAAIAVALGRAGMHVAVHYHGSASGAVATCQAITAAGGRALPIQADLRDEAEVSRLAGQALSGLGGLDLLVPSAASYETAGLAGVSAGSFQSEMALNVLAPMLLVRELSAALRASGGSVVFITCISRMTPLPAHLTYQLSKAALHQAMRALALELAPQVRVNAVAPGTVLPPEGLRLEEVAELVERIPLGRIGGADTVAEAVLHLARSPFVTGTELAVDGGRSLA
jgi:pteridine reductase